MVHWLNYRFSPTARHRPLVHCLSYLVFVLTGNKQPSQVALCPILIQLIKTDLSLLKHTFYVYIAIRFQNDEIVSLLSQAEVLFCCYHLFCICTNSIPSIKKRFCRIRCEKERKRTFIWSHCKEYQSFITTFCAEIPCTTSSNWNKSIPYNLYDLRSQNTSHL